MPLPITPPVDYIISTLSERSVRIFFQDIIEERLATDIGYYSFSLISFPAYLPNILRIKPYSTDGRQYEVIFDDPLTYSSIYSLSISSDLKSVNGISVSSLGHNFTANVSGGPVAVGAYLSIRSHIDIVFDRDVGPYSSITSADITNGIVPGVAMAQVPWTSSIPARNLRFIIPPAVPGGDEWYITCRSARDIALNVRTSTVKVEIPAAVPRPLSYLDTALQLRLLDSFVTNYLTYLEINNIRAYFNFACDSASSGNIANYQLFQIDTHPTVDNTNFVTAVDAFNLVDLIPLAQDIKDRYNDHMSAAQVHKVPDLDIITAPNPSDLLSCYNVVVQALNFYRLHIVSEIFHDSKDGINFPLLGFPDSSNLASICLYANNLKAVFNTHISTDFLVPFGSAGFVGFITNDFVISSSNPLDSNHTWCLDIRVKSLSPKTRYRLECSVLSSDLLSSTNPANSTGSITVKSGENPVYSLSTYREELNQILSKTNRNISVIDSEVITENLSNNIISSKSSPECVLWALQELWVQYDNHRLYQSHYVSDGINFIDFSDLPTINSIVDSTNKFLRKFNAHRTGAVFHGISDIFNPDLVEATTYEQAVELLVKLRETFNNHTNDRSLHVNISRSWLSSPMSDSLYINTPIQTISSDYSLDIPISSKMVYLDNPDSFTLYSTININYVGRGAPPEIAAVIPVQAVSFYRENPSFTSDYLEVFFDKPMTKTDLSGVTISVLIPGDPPIVINKLHWASDYSIIINVGGMNSNQYLLNASSLKDLAGNSVI